MKRAVALNEVWSKWANTWVLWGALNILGILLIALEDPDRRVFSLSETHGPGPADLVGAVLLLAGWAILDFQIWKRRYRLKALSLEQRLWWFAVPAVAGAGLVVWSVSNDEGMWWLLGAGVLGAVQAGAAVVGARVRP